LDSSFGNNGKVITPIGTGSSKALALAIQTNGKILVGGTGNATNSWGNTSQDFALVRYNANGTIDNGFANNGISIREMSSTYFGTTDEIRKLIIRPDGKIIAGGYASGFNLTSFKNYAMAIYNVSGGIDSTAGTDGSYDLLHTVTDRHYFAMALQSNGMIILGGGNRATCFELVRLTPSLQQDNSFGTNGKVLVTHPSNGGGRFDIAIQPDDKIIVTGGNDESNGFDILRYRANGILDNSFGTAGRRKLIMKNNPSNLHLQPNGNIVISGTANWYSYLGDFSIMRFDSTGRTDSSFGRRGFLRTDFLGFEEETIASVVQPDGKIILVGEVAPANTSYTPWKFGLTRYEKDAREKYNTVNAKVFVDRNSNHILDAGEQLFSSATLSTIKPNVDTVLSALTNGSGFNDVDTGTYTTKLLFNKPYYTVHPIVHNSSFSNYFGNDTVAFALQPIPLKRDLSISLMALTVARPFFPLTYRLIYKNTGTDTVASASISFQKDPLLVYLSASSTPATIAGNLYTWAIPNLKPEDTGSIFIYMRVPAPPLANLLDTIRSSANIGPLPTHQYFPGASSTLVQVLQSSCDPNDKTETHAGSINKAQVLAGEDLQYMIRFQNTGNDTAFNVYIRDTLSSKVNWSSMEMVAASHPYQFRMDESGRCQWTFSNINLVDSIHNEPLSHGYIVYRIKPNTSVASGETINNSASIYFDYNLPVLTNTSITKITAEVLPVHLLSFAASRQGTDNMLQWSTSQEINLSGFAMEKSSNGKDFTTMGWQAAGTNSYVFIDVHPLKAKNYYRLKLVDKDGSYSYSVIQMVDNSKGLIVSVYPNPTKGQLNLLLNSESRQLASISILTLDGREMIKQQVELKVGINLLPLGIHHLLPAHYFLKVIGKDGHSMVLSFSKL
jgi:uncharacterized delta-60 repeat protein/uncharacterized repeat protein (TIGR01451 family)